MANVNVFPEPVDAIPIISLPDSLNLIVDLFKNHIPYRDALHLDCRRNFYIFPVQRFQHSSGKFHFLNKGITFNLKKKNLPKSFQ